MAAARRAMTAGSSLDSRSFPKFQPMPSNANNRCRPKHQPLTPPPPPPHCGRAHTIKPKNQCPDIPDEDADGRQICCSGHPNVASCCSARATAMPPGSAGYSACRRPYKPPPPLGGNCGRIVSLASLIYRPEDEPLSMEEGAAWETDGEAPTATATATTGARTDDAATAGEGEGADLIATHSCPVSSASPESRQGCCRRPPGQPPPLSQLQVLIQQPEREIAPINANQTEPAKPDGKHQRRRKLFFPSLSRRKKEARVQRRRSITEPPQPLQPQPTTAPTQKPLPAERQNQQQQHQQQRQQSSARTKASLPLARQPWWQQQQQHNQHQQYQNWQTAPSQQPLCLHSLSSPAPLGDSKIYTCSDRGPIECELPNLRSPPRLHPCQRQHLQQQQQQQQLMNRGPLSGLVRSRDSYSLQPYYSSRSSSASEF